MTESERIVEAGILPEDYFQEEVRDDFLVDVKRKKMWAVGLDLLLKFDAVCKEHGLKYFLTFGTLLGAVRHKGFIPWDDDVDVGMLRSDYEKFLRLGKVFEEPYFLQTPYTDEESYYSWTRLRNSNTTAMSKIMAFNRFNQGLYLDIMPFDYVDAAFGEENQNAIKKLILDVSAWLRRNNPYLSERDKERVRNYSGRNPLEICEEVQKLAIGKGIPTDHVSPAVCTIYPYRRNCFFTEDFEETIQVPFEGYMFPAPSGYDRILRTTYGDYLQFPPMEERGVAHNTGFRDPDAPYTKYLYRHIE